MISTLNAKSDNHLHCEDSLYVKENEISISGGVFDGCSTGTDSQWASKTLAYLFTKEDDPTDFSSVYNVFLSMRKLVEELNITEMNFLSTCLLFYYNKMTKKLCFRALGDGFYYVNDLEYHLEQNNTPDYLAYLLRSENIMKDFPDYMNKYSKIKFEDVNSFRICSDGIEKIDISQFKEPKETEPLKLLFHPPTSPNYLTRMWNKLRRDGYTLSDDLSIISYVTD